MSETPEKILLVDDNTVNLTVIKGVLSNVYKVYPVNSGATALKFLEKQRPDLILLDVEMPEMSGPELIKILKSDPKLSAIPVIFLTANNSIETEEESFRLGAVDYIRKPMNELIAFARIKMHLELAAYRNSAPS